MSRCPSRRLTMPIRRPLCSSSSWHTPIPGNTRLMISSPILGTVEVGPKRGPCSRGVVVLPVLGLDTRAGSSSLEAAQLDPADLAADRLRQVGELQAADPLVRCQILASVPQDVARQLLRRLVSRDED